MNKTKIGIFLSWMLLVLLVCLFLWRAKIEQQAGAE